MSWRNKMDFLTITLGCKVNLYETESLIEYLENKGWKYKKIVMM